MSYVSIAPLYYKQEATTNSRRRCKHNEGSARATVEGKGKARTFVENEQLATAYYCTPERQDLPLANREVASAARNLAIESEAAVLVVAL